MECIMLNTTTFKPTLKISVPISPSSVLEWIGFQDTSSFFTFDSSGVLRMLHNASWIPILDTRKSKNDRVETYWAVGLTETSLMCVICKGGDRYPPFPKPLLHELPLQIPLLNLDNSQGVFEEKRIRASIKIQECTSTTNFESERQSMYIEMDKLTLQLFQV